MLIKALCDYYDTLAESGKVLKDGYSNVKIKYVICLSKEGLINEIINYQRKDYVQVGKDKIKEVLVPRDVVMPQRTEKPGIEANVIEHRPLYIFGLNLRDGMLTAEDNTDKAKKSHLSFVKTNLEFLEGLDSPVVNAYRLFIQNWNPEEETENPFLISIGKDYNTAGFAFCLDGEVELLLHNEIQVREKWDELRKIQENSTQDVILARCAISGEKAPIARIHRKIKGVYGGLAVGNVLISYKNSSENSYGNEQSFNSNISEPVMKKYTEALNYLLEGKKHKRHIDDITILHWTQSSNELYDDLFAALCFNDTDTLDAEQTDSMLQQLMEDASEGSIMSERISTTENLDTNVDFYILGLKPNSSRIAVKFLYHKKFGEILTNIASHQNDMQIGDNPSSIPLWRIKKEIISPKSTNETIDPALLAKILESIVYARNYPSFLLATMVKRVKTDSDMVVNNVRAGVIKACINRKSRTMNQKEELKVALDKENKNVAYLCGRLFAVLEKLQQDASGNSLNRTIKDSYFASAASKPAIVFPNLLKLAQNHLNKAKRATYFNILIQEIIDNLPGGFPDILTLTEQGRFIIGYYQQYENFFVKKEQANNNNEEEQEHGNRE